MQNTLKQLADLRNRIEGEKCFVKSSLLLERQGSDSQIPKVVDHLHSFGYSLQACNLLHESEDFAPGFIAKNSLVNLPPDCLPVSCKPVLFDLALSSCDFPSLEGRKKSQSRSFFKFWGR